MAEVSIDITGADKVARNFRNIAEFLASREPIQAILSEIKETILTKTERGLDYMSRRFQPYSKAYAKKKGQSRVNLLESGDMMGSIDTEVNGPRSGRVFINNSDRELIAFFHNKGGPRPGRPPQREFFNIAKSAIAKMAKKYIDDPIMKILGRR